MNSEPQELASPEETDVIRLRLDRLARRYYAPLMSFFRKRTRGAAEVQDLVQQVFLRLAAHRGVDKNSNVEGYIFQTASNTLKDHVRNAAVRHRFFNKQIEMEDPSRSDFSP